MSLHASSEKNFHKRREISEAVKFGDEDNLPGGNRGSSHSTRMRRSSLLNGRVANKIWMYSSIASVLA